VTKLIKPNQKPHEWSSKNSWRKNQRAERNQIIISLLGFGEWTPSTSLLPEFFFIYFL